MGGQHPVLDVHAGIQGLFIDLAQDDRLIGSLLRVFGDQHRPTGVQGRIKIIMAAMDVQGLLGERARANFNHHGRELAGRVVILLHRVNNPLAGREIDGTSSRYGVRRGATLGGVLAFALNGNLLLAENVEFSLRVGLLINLSPFSRRSYGIENTAFRDAGFDVLCNELIPVTRDPDTGIFWRAASGLTFWT